MYAAFSAKAGVLSALLAERGVTGAKTAFEGNVGFFKTYFNGNYNRDKILEGLGTDYLGDTTLYKPWPAVGPAHSHIHATIQLVTRHDLKAEDIEEIRVYVGDYQQIMCSPLESRRAPATLVDAKFSLPFLVAVAAVGRDVRISDFTGNALKDPQVLAIARKVVPVPDATFDWKFELPLGRVEILTTDGRKLELVGTDVPGSSQAPLPWEDISRKFGECASVAAVPPSVAQIAKVREMARHLESLDDATELLRVLA
jgi:2-methylcitrate dehydratase PrpD